MLAAVPLRHGAGVQVGRSGQEFRHQRRQGVERPLRTMAGGDALGLGVDGRQHLGGFSGEILGQATVDAALELGGLVREGGAVAVEQGLPLLLPLGAGIATVPGGAHVGGDFERAGGDAQRGAGGGDFGVAERIAVHAGGVLAVGRALADDRAAADQRRLFGLGLGLLDRLVQRLDVMAVDAGNHVPAIGFEALGRVVAEPVGDAAVDGDAVVVPEGDQLVELPGAGQRAGLVRDAFHEAAVADEGVGVVVDDGETGAVELDAQELLGEREADGVGQSLADRAGGRLDAGGVAVFGVAGQAAAQLAEVLDVVQRHVIAGEMQHRIDQHRRMAVGQHEAVAVDPLRVGRIMVEVARPQGGAHFRHAHGGTRMAATGGLHRVDGQDANRIGQCGG